MAVSNEPVTPGVRARFYQRTMHWGEQAYIRLYRLLGGRVVDRWTPGPRVILITTTGRRSGAPRTVALGHLEMGDGLMVAGTNAGLPKTPNWVYNLRTDPACVVQAGYEVFEARAEFLEGREWEEHWSLLTSAYPLYGQAPGLAGRPIPLVLLKAIDG